MKDSLSDYEMSLVTNAQVILVKNKIINNVFDLFGRVVSYYSQVIKEQAISGVIKDAKISKGENYEGLPYVVLDYPREFALTDTFAVRTFFWWGNFFSITIQLAGKHNQKHFFSIKKALQKGELNGWYVGVGDTQWQHHFESDNYLPIDDTTDISATGSFIKIAKKIPLQQWDDAETFFKENFLFLIKIISA